MRWAEQRTAPIIGRHFHIQRILFKKGGGFSRFIFTSRRHQINSGKQETSSRSFVFVKTDGDVCDSSQTSESSGEQIYFYQRAGEEDSLELERVSVLTTLPDLPVDLRHSPRLPPSSSGQSEIRNGNQFLHTRLYRKQNVLMAQQ